MWGWGTVHTQTCMLACKHLYSIVIFSLGSSQGCIFRCCREFRIDVVTHGNWCLCMVLWVFIHNCFCVTSVPIHVQVNIYACMSVYMHIPLFCKKKSDAKTLSAVLSHQSPCHFNLCATSGCIVVYFGRENITIAQLKGEVALVLQHIYCFLTLYGLKEIPCIVSKAIYSVDMLVKEDIGVFTNVKSQCLKCLFTQHEIKIKIKVPSWL